MKNYLQIISSFNKGGSNVVAGTELLGDQELLYVPTFEEKLVQIITEKENTSNQIDLIIISGTAGDGKTVFLSKFKELIGNTINGRRIEYNLDASHADKPDKNQLDDLKIFFREYSDSSIQNKPKVLKMIAINTGMLMHFFKNMKDTVQKYKWLEYFTLKNLNLPIKQEKPTTKEPVWNVSFIDLSIRDIFAGNDSIFDSIITNLNEKVVLSSQCQECSVRNYCYLISNISMINNNDTVKEQIKNLFMKYEIEETSHITLRLFLETISYLIAGHFSEYKFQTCQEEIIEFKREFDESGDRSQFDHLFYNKIFLLNEKALYKLIDLKTLDFFKNYRPIFLSTKNWINYMSYSFASLVSEIGRMKENFDSLEEIFFIRLQKDIAEMEEELIGRENQNQRYIKSVMNELRSLKSESFQYIIQRQFFFQQFPIPETQIKDQDIKSQCLDEFRNLVRYKNEANNEIPDKLKFRLIRRICRALSLSDSYADTLQKFNKEPNEIVLQKKILRLNRIPSVSSLVRLSIDMRKSEIRIPFSYEFRDVFAQLPIRIQIILRVNGDKPISFELDFKTYYFLFKMAYGYRPSTLDQRKYEEIELIKRKLLYLASSKDYKLDLIAQDMCTLKINTDEKGSFFSWRLQC